MKLHLPFPSRISRQCDRIWLRNSFVRSLMPCSPENARPDSGPDGSPDSVPVPFSMPERKPKEELVNVH